MNLHAILDLLKKKREVLTILRKVKSSTSQLLSLIYDTEEIARLIDDKQFSFAYLSSDEYPDYDVIFAL